MSNLLMRRPTLDALPPVPELPVGYSLRLFQAGDLESLAALMRSAFEDEVWTPEWVRETLTESPEVKAVYVIEYGGKIVATASARIVEDVFPGSGYLHWVAVAPEHRGKHLGAAISLAVLYEFARLGCKDAVLETQDSRLPAIKTYRSLGFVPEHTHESHPERWGKIAELLTAIGL